MKRPTDRQFDVMVAIDLLTRKHGYPPSISEIASYFGWRSHNAARDHLVYLRSKGLVDWAVSRIGGGAAKRSIHLTVPLRKPKRIKRTDENFFQFVRCGSCARDVLLVDGRCFECEGKMVAA